MSTKTTEPEVGNLLGELVGGLFGVAASVVTTLPGAMVESYNSMTEEVEARNKQEVEQRNNNAKVNDKIRESSELVTNAMLKESGIEFLTDEDIKKIRKYAGTVILERVKQNITQPKG